MRLNEGEVSVCANAFVLRGVPEMSGFGVDGREYLLSPKAKEVARELAARVLTPFSQPISLHWEKKCMRAHSLEARF